jgi:hypothetical protein
MAFIFALLVLITAGTVVGAEMAKEAGIIVVAHPVPS